MNYSLTLGEFENIDLSKISIEKKQAFDLKFIDELTMECKDEKELKEYLLQKGLITDDDLEKKLCISYGKKHRRNIPILYAPEKEIVSKIRGLADDIKKYFKRKKDSANSDLTYNLIMDDYSDITSYFSSFEIFAGNHNFLRALQEYVSNNPKQNLNIKDINVYINQFSGNRKIKVIYIALFEIFRRLFYNFNDEKKDLLFNYKGFRDFCVFYCNYKKKLEAKKRNIERIERPQLDVISEEENKDNRTLGSEGEPDFPYNSEEERDYQKYLEDLPEEEHPHYRR